MKILVVDDEFTSRMVLQNLLSRYGECHIAVNGEEAVAAFCMSRDRGTPYDLICMDIRLPGFDGVEAVRKIRAAEEVDGVPFSCGAKILMTTAVDNLKEVMQSFRALCDGYIVKPVRAADLLEKLSGLALIP